MTAVPSDVVTRRKAAITSLTTAGYTLIPLRGKIPVDKGWQTTLAGAYGAAELGEGNYGVALRSTDLVVDVDPRNFNPVTESGDNNPLARLLKDLNGETDTLIVRTGGGGLHIYMTLPEGVIVANTIAKYGKGVEFKSAGRQVVGPGSIHPETGKEYEIVRGDAASIMAAPESLIADIKKIPISHKGDKGTSSYKDDKYTQDSFISYLQQSAQPSIEGQQGDLQAFRVGCHAKEMGLSPAVAFELMMEFWNPTCVPPWGEEELGEKIGNAYTYAKSPVGAAHPESDFSPIEAPPPAKKEIEIRWDLTANGAVRKSFVNLLNYLNQPGGPLRGIFGRNDFAQQAEIVNPAPWHNGRMPPCVGVGDHDLKMLKGYLATAHNFEMPIGNIEEAVAVVAHHNHFHPIKEYLEGLKWDGEKRLDLWLIRGGGAVDTPYVRAVSRKVLCAAVMRIFRPGIKFDSVLVLEGGQGIGKSGLCKIMGGEWYGEFTVNPHDKDTIQLMQGKWIMEIAEMAQGRKVENEAKKAFITRATDKARLAYGRLAAEYPRQSVFFATTNPKADGVYLDDDTGNRRWWPFSFAASWARWWISSGSKRTETRYLRRRWPRRARGRTFTWTLRSYRPRRQLRPRSVTPWRSGRSAWVIGWLGFPLTGTSSRPEIFSWTHCRVWTSS